MNNKDKAKISSSWHRGRISALLKMLDNHELSREEVAILVSHYGSELKKLFEDVDEADSYIGTRIDAILSRIKSRGVEDSITVVDLNETDWHE